MTGQSRRHALREAARTAHRNGWMPIPVPARSKNPNRKGWQHERITEDDIDARFGDDSLNIGILLGEPSEWLVDVDLDCPEAILLASVVLPVTDARFGRQSAPASHWLYWVTEAVKTHKFRDPTKPDDDERAMLVELRSTGSHTLIPPSIHPSGEEVHWDRYGDPADVDPAILLRVVRRLAAASLLARHWPAAGSRHDAALALSGGVLRAGWSAEDVATFIHAVALAAGDEEIDDRLQAVWSTAEALAANRQVTGWPTLAELIGDTVVSKVRTWLGATKENQHTSSSNEKGNGGADRESSQASLIVDLVKAQRIDLFHDTQGDPYLSFTTGGHLETWPLKAKTVRIFLSRLYYLHAGKAPNSQALQDALNVLDGEARFAGPERSVAVRLADVDSTLYLDLGNPAWQVVVIRPGSWEIVGPEEVPVRFRRPRGMEALPDPHRDGSLGPLRALLNVSDESDTLLIVGWLLGCLYPRGPRPVLQLLGEQGSAKSSLARLLRSLVDPNTVPLRTQPKDEGDLLIAATNGLLVALDNLSEIKSWLSDALCRLATGGGLSKRELYTDTDEVLLDAKRPVLLTAISEVATSSDLLDRCITVTLPPILPEQRKTEAEIELLVRIARPAVLGALLDAGAAALVRLPTTVLDRKPRMADFATWVEAAAPSLGWEEGAFLDALEANRKNADAVAIEALPIGPVLLTFMTEREEWAGTATELLSELSALASDEVKKEGGWPKRANGLSNQLRRLAPNLRRIGIGVGGDRKGGSGQRRVILTKNSEVFDRHHRHDRHSEDDSGTDEDEATDEEIVTPSSHDRQGSSQGEPEPAPVQARIELHAAGVTVCDDGDDDSPFFSDEAQPDDDDQPGADVSRRCVVCRAPLAGDQRFVCDDCSLLDPRSPPPDADVRGAI